MLLTGKLSVVCRNLSVARAKSFFAYFSSPRETKIVALICDAEPEVSQPHKCQVTYPGRRTYLRFERRC